MKRVTYLIYLTALLLAGCEETNYKKQGIVIEGDIRGLSAKKLYLTDAFKWETLLDSVEVKDGEFELILKADPACEPFPMSLYYKDSVGKMKPLLFVVSKNKTNSAFFPGKTEVSISGDFLKKALRVDAGKDNELFWATNGSLDVGYIKDSVGKKRNRKLSFTRKLIKENPKSYVLMHGLYSNRFRLSNEEMQSFLRLFNKELQQSKNGQLLQRFVAKRPEPTAIAANLVLMNNNNQAGAIIDSSAKINVLVFWASWCGPCKAEIPHLRKVYEQFHDKGVRLTGISIDTDPDKWRAAIDKYSLPWPQFIAGRERNDEVQTLYNFNSIPLIVITDAHGRILNRSKGYDAKDAPLYSQRIGTLLASQQ